MDYKQTEPQAEQKAETQPEAVLRQSLSDLEGQKLLEDGQLSLQTATAISPTNLDLVEHEYQVPAARKLTFLVAYMALNLGLTLHSKMLLQKIPCPWMLTALHATCSWLGCMSLAVIGKMKFTRLTTENQLRLLAFSFLFTINIAMSNVSLAMVSVPVHQTIRACCPLFTVAIYKLVFARQYSVATQVSLLPVIVGAAMTAYGDVSFTGVGILLTTVGAILAAVKTICTNKFLTGDIALSALEVLARMSPMAAVQSLAVAFVVGEGRFALETVSNTSHWKTMGATITINGLLALLLNITSFQTNKLAGALTLNVCSNVKQTLTIAIGIVAFDVHVGWLNGVGMAITTAGAAWFGRTELRSKIESRS